MATTGISPTLTYTAGTVSRPAGGKAASVSEAYAGAGSAITGGTDTRSVDRLELSEQGQLLSRAADLASGLNSLPDARDDAIDKAKAMIESGELFSPSALKQAARNIGRFLKQ